jgi:hypothetical protein
MNAVHTFTRYLIRIQFNVIFHLCLGLDLVLTPSSETNCLLKGNFYITSKNSINSGKIEMFLNILLLPTRYVF